MAVHGDRPPGGGRSASGLAAVAHDTTLDGDGTARNPIGLAAAETAKIDEAHDVHRAVLARWTVTAGELGSGRLADSYGYTRIIQSSADGEPNRTAGSIDPDPPTLSEGSSTWRLLAVRQDATGHDVEIVLGAPLGPRTVHARGRIDFAAANQFVEVPGAYRIPASRDVAYEVEVPSGGGQFTRLEVTADQLRALTPAARGQSSSPQGHSVELGTENGLTYRAGRTALGVILLSMSSAGAQNVGVFSDDGPPAADPPDVPTWIDWRLGTRTLRGRDARVGAGRRQQPPGGSLRDEGFVQLSWRVDPTTGLRFAAGVISDGAAVTLDALGRDVSTSRLLPATPTDGQVPQYDASNARWNSVDPSALGVGGGQGQGQQTAGATLDSLIGARSAVALTQAQARLDLSSLDGTRVAVRTAAAPLPAAAAAGDRLIARWAWVARPGAARLAQLTIGLRDVTGGSDLDVVWPIWDADDGILSWELPAGCASVQFVGTFDPPGQTVARATIDLSGAEMHTGAQAISRYVEGRARRAASLAAAQAEERAGASAAAGDVLIHAALDASLTAAVRTARWARAWIRAADQAAALAGTAAATWTNQGAGTAPTGAHWSPADVPAGAGRLYELVSLVSPTAGSSDAWTFGGWTALEVTATNTQYSVDGSSAWHAVRAQADRYERHLQADGWGPAIALYGVGALDWALLLQADVYHATSNLPNLLLSLPSRTVFANLKEMRIRLGTYLSGARVVESSITVDPRIFISVPWADRGESNPQSRTVWTATVDIDGVGVAAGLRGLGASGPAGVGTSAGMELVWVRPNALSHAGEAAHLRVFYMLNRAVTHRLRIEAR